MSCSLFKTSCLLILIILLVIDPYSAFSQLFFNENQAVEDEKASCSKFKVNIDGGLAYLLGSAENAKAQLRTYEINDAAAEKYYRGLKMGTQAGAAIQYMISPNKSLGFDYSIFMTSGSEMGWFDIGDGWSKFYGPFSEKIYTSFIGLSYSESKNLNRKWTYDTKFSLGLSLYRNEANLIMVPFLLTGKAPAMVGESGISYSINKHISLRTSISVFYAYLMKYNMNDGNTVTEVKLTYETKEDLSRISLSTGIQFNF